MKYQVEFNLFLVVDVDEAEQAEDVAKELLATMTKKQIMAAGLAISESEDAIQELE